MTVPNLKDADNTASAAPAAPGPRDGDDRPSTREELGRYAEQGGFTLTAAANPWLEAADSIAGAEDARAASSVLAELRSRDIRAIGSSVTGIAAKAGLDVPETLIGLATLLDLLQRVHATAAVLTAAAYDADLDALTAATASGRWRKDQGVKLSWGLRRTLRSTARGYAVGGKRAGRADLHAALLAAGTVRADWAALAAEGTTARPSVPVDGTLLAETAQAVESLADAVRTLGRLLPDRSLDTHPLGELADLVDRLAADEGTLYRLPALRELRTALDEQGLGDLLTELSERQADRDAALAAYDRHLEPESARSALAAGPRTPADETVTDAATAAQPETEPETDVEPAAEVTTEAKADVEPVAEVTTEAEADVEPVAEVTTEAEADPEPEPVAELEVAAEAETVTEAEAATESVADVEAAVEPVAVEDAATEVEADAEPEPVAVAEAEAAAEPEPEADPKVVAEVEAEVASEPVAVAEVEVAAESEAEPVVEVEAAAEPEVAAEPATAPEADVEPEVEAAAEAEVIASPESEAVTDAEAAVEPETAAEVEAEVVVVAAVEPEADVELVAEVEPEPVVETVAEAEPVAEVESEPVVEAAAEAEPVAEVESEAVVEAGGRPARPAVVAGRPVTAYEPAELVALVRWLDTDGSTRSDDELLRAAMKELGFARLGPRIKEALGAAVAEVRTA
ncbi:hypothetical protein [Kitasatospora terrestris]